MNALYAGALRLRVLQFNLRFQLSLGVKERCCCETHLLQMNSKITIFKMMQFFMWQFS